MFKAFDFVVALKEEPDSITIMEVHPFTFLVPIGMTKIEKNEESDIVATTTLAFIDKIAETFIIYEVL